MRRLRHHEVSKLLGYYGVLVGIGLMVGVLGPTLGPLAAQTGTSLPQVSLILALRPLGYMAGALLAGRWMDHRAGHPILAGAMLLAATMLALMPLAASLFVLGLCVLGVGLGQGLMDVGSTTLLGWVFYGRLGPYVAGLHFSFGLGAFIAPLIAAAALSSGAGVAGAYWPLAAFLVPLAAWLLWLPSPGHEQGAEGAVAMPRDRGLVGLFVLFFFLYGGLETGFGVWIYQYALDLGVADLKHAALLSSLFWGLLGLGRLLGIPVLARFSPGAFLRVLLPASLAAMLSVLLWPTLPAALWLGCGAFGLFMACIFPTLIVFANERLGGGQRLSGRLTSIFFLGSSSGSMCLPWLMGQAFGPWGPRRALGIGVVNLLGMLTVFVLMQGRRRMDAAGTVGVS